jgi:hypothetical protein
MHRSRGAVSPAVPNRTMVMRSPKEAAQPRLLPDVVGQFNALSPGPDPLGWDVEKALDSTNAQAVKSRFSPEGYGSGAALQLFAPQYIDGIYG